jgi:cell division protein FtsB
MILPLIIIAVLIVSAFILAGPVCTLYAAWRDAGIVEAEYDALVEQNQELQGRLDDLNSLPGIEDEARRRGYAYPDEEALIVDNLEQEILADPAKVDEAIAEHEANMPWYVDVLDTLLGYEAKVD